MNAKSNDSDIKTKIISTNISSTKGKSKYPVPEITLSEIGVDGDSHSGIGNRQISILGQESIDNFNARTGRQIKAGEFAENLTVCGIDPSKINVLDRIKINDAVLEITQLGKKCHGDVCAIFREVGQCAMPKEGYFARVISGGKVKPEDDFEFLPKTLEILIVTLSDRASAKVYEDKSGPAVKNAIIEFFQGKRWHWHINTLLQNDDELQLKKALQHAIKSGIDIIFTLGGTGVGPRDNAPEAVISVCDKIIPGVMENIRAKYGVENPRALLSRSVAAVSGKTLIYTLPGSVRAGAEYLAEIFKTLEHTIYMMHGLDLH